MGRSDIAFLFSGALLLACDASLQEPQACEGEVCPAKTRPSGASVEPGGDPSTTGASSGSPASASTSNRTSNRTPTGTPACPAPQVFPEVALEPKPASPVPVRWHLNHLGYGTTAPKVALVEATAPVTKFQLVSADDGRVRDAGALREVPGFSDWGGGPFFAVADFSKFREVGRFRLRVQGQESDPFDVGPQVLFRSTGPLVLQYFRNSRADERDLATWTADGQMGFPNRGERRNVQGGWYDASGDVSKYLSHLSYANFLNPQQIPLTAWALAWVADEGREVVRGQGLEQATVEEALWGADFLVRMQDPEGYFYATVFDGWSGKAESRQICAFNGEAGQRHANYQAAFREGGGLAIAALARISRWNKDGAYPSFHYLAVAEKGFRHLVAKKAQYCDDGRENLLDDYAALLAATELFRATDKAVYLDHARKRVEALAGKLHASGYFLADGVKRPFWHGSDAGLPLFSLVLYAAAEPDAGRRALAEGTAQRHLSYLLEVAENVANPYGYARQSFLWEGSVRHGFFMPHENESGYWWQGENARLASLAAAVLVAGRRLRPDPCAPLGVEEAVGRYALAQVDWILGKNPYDVSFLEGVGRRGSPPYCSLKFHGHLPGGIANGITGLRSDGRGITFDGPTEPEKCWQQWRWREQWLPHASWYWVALTALTLGEERP